MGTRTALSIGWVVLTEHDVIPPESLEAERALLGAMIVDKELIPAVSAVVCEADFYAHVHAPLYRVMLDLRAACNPTDKIAVAEELRRRGQLDHCGGISYLSALMDTVQTASSALYYAKRVRDTATLRRIMAASLDLHKDAQTGDYDPSELIQSFAKKFTSERNNVVTSPQLFGELWEQSKQLPRLHMGLTFGLARVNEATYGMQPGEIITIGARPGVGKSAAVEIIAGDNSANVPVLLFALEMGALYTTDRLASRMAGQSVTQYLSGGRKAELVVADPTQHYNLRIEDNRAKVDLTHINALIKQCEPRLVIIDQVRDIKGWFANDNRRADLGPTDILYGLKEIVKRNRITLLLLQQLNRNADGKRPQLSDIRDAGALEEISDKVILLHRPFDGDPDADTIAEWIVLKNRMGPKGIIHSRWDGPAMTFGSFAADETYFPCCAPASYSRKAKAV